MAVGREASNRQAGIALGYLAGALQHLALYDEALDAAEEAQELIPPNDPSLLPVLTLLGSLYRSAGDSIKAESVALQGAKIAESLGDRLQLAILLNVMAGISRRSDITRAEGYARRSVELGLRLNNPRHLSQAYNTLASVLLDVRHRQGALDEAEEMAERSKELLTRLGDMRGLRFVERTLEGIRRARSGQPR